MNYKIYQLGQGDTLDEVAQRNGFPSHEDLYNHTANKDFRINRPDPNEVQAGDIIRIPDSPVASLEERLARLIELRAEYASFVDEIIREQDKMYQQDVVRTGQMVDTAAALIDMGRSLGTLIKTGYTAIVKRADRLAEVNAKVAERYYAMVNNKVATDVLKSRAKSSAEKVAQATLGTETTGEEGMAYAITKIVVKSWFDMTSPSYWAKRFTGVDQVYQQTKTDLQRMKLDSFANWDQRIRETREEILELKAQGYH